ncbi:Uncharacterised protein [Salmonella enterica subsp. enterica serovar Bovismorbificans]|uniref:Uncharacterized protein n=1 Tax=Salmonella enterica subsp. enterica serovar Bovismorbificans TaxID=58097 RepID=A0A655BMI9_SALET|nr:Uncharacterised protein [Salmonella enterica subsp. enterica serovar Bovismorbificans]CNU34532.1 Uncharacterised protein [Salmonella enterica subsp. enterica serovar Bovismorbificans]
MINAKDVFQYIADNNELYHRPAYAPQNIFFQRQLFLVTDEHRDHHQQHR